MTHEVGHALGFRHGSCGQTTPVMYGTVTVPPQGQAGDVNQYIGRFTATTNTDRCSVYSEYRPVSAFITPLV